MARKRAWWSSIAAALLIAAGLAWAALVLAAPSAQPATRPSAATLNVTTTADTATCGTPCSLRGAIAAAASGDTIIIPAGTFTLTSLFELTIDKSLNLEGTGSGDTIIQAADQPNVSDFRVFNINTGSVAISGVTIRHGNSITDNHGGIFNSGGTLTITSSTVSSNGGTGIFNAGGTLTLTNSMVSGNNGHGIRGGGTITVIDSTISGNNNNGIHNSGAMTVTGSTISGDSDNEGIINTGTITVTDSTISGHSRGGIINHGTMTVTVSTISGNLGGGIHNSGTMAVTNSTISDNSAGSDGGGVSNFGTLNVTNSTISGNNANSGSGGGIFNNDGATVRLVNTIVARNTASLRPDCRGVITSLGRNLIGDTTGCGFTPSATGDLVNVDPLLGLLRDNGGPTLTHALLSGSPAIDTGDDASCPATDQRGVARPQGAQCDIGAFEFVGTIPPRAFDQAVTTTGDRPVNITLAASDPDTGDTLTFIIVSPPASGDLFMGNSVAGEKLTTGDSPITGDTVTYKARLGFAGTDRFSFKANDGTADSNIATVTILVNGPTVQGAVTLEGMPEPISGARITFSSGGQVIGLVFGDPEDGSFELQLTSGIYHVKAEKDGFLPATKAGVVLNQDLSLPGVKLLWGDVNGDGVDVKDLTAPARNLGKIESPWLEEPLAGCVGLGAITGNNTRQFSQPPLMTIQVENLYIARVATNKGTFVIELLPNETPLTVNNFVFLSRDGFYNGLIFHRVIENFMIQGGDPTGTGTGGPGYTFEELVPSLVFDSPGLLAMANAGPNTNGSQFFITTVPTPHLNGQHTIFGRVLEGQDVVDAISKVPTGNVNRPIEDIIIECIEIEETTPGT